MMNLTKLWKMAGRLTGPTPLLVSRRGRVRPPTREEAAAMLEAALAALEAAGAPVRVMNTADCAMVLIKGTRWTHEKDLVISASATGAAVGSLQPEPVRASGEGDPNPDAVALSHGPR